MNPTQAPSPWTPPVIAPISFKANGLLLRAHVPGTDDSRRLHDAVVLSRPTLHPWLPWALISHQTRDESEAWIAKTHAQMQDSAAKPVDADTAYIFGIFDSGSGELLGGVGFNRMNPVTHNAETGYWVRSDRRREGIAARAHAACLSWGFTPQSQGGFGYRRIHVFVAEPNHASRGVPTKLGLHLASHTRQDRWVDGYGWTDTLVWDVLAHEWDVRAHALRR